MTGATIPAAVSDALALDALVHMDPQERRDAIWFFDVVLERLRLGHDETAAVCAECGWHLILRAYHAELARRGGSEC